MGIPQKFKHVFSMLPGHSTTKYLFKVLIYECIVVEMNTCILSHSKTQRKELNNIFD